MSWTQVFSTNGHPSLGSRRGSWVLFVSAAEIESVWQDIKGKTESGVLIGYMASRSTSPMRRGAHEGCTTICVFCENRQSSQLREQLVGFGYQAYINDFRPIRSQREGENVQEERDWFNFWDGMEDYEGYEDYEVEGVPDEEEAASDEENNAVWDMEHEE